MKNIVTKFTALALVLTATAAITAPARALSVSLPGLSAAASGCVATPVANACL